MEHTLPPIRATRWRTATVVASAVAALELVLLVVLGAALLAKPVSRHVTQAAEQQVMAPVVKRRPQSATAAAPLLSRGETSVLVLNGNGRPGAAGAAAEQVRRLGYTIGGVGNADRSDHARSVVMYRGDHAREARRLARELRIEIVGPLDGVKPAELLGAHLAVVVGD